MPAARGPDMHHASLCTGTYPQGLRDANGLVEGRCGEEASAGFLLRGKQDRIQWSIFPLITETDIRLSETENCLSEEGSESDFCLSEAQKTSQRTPQ